MKTETITWFSASEQLPDEEVHVLAQCDCGFICMAYLFDGEWWDAFSSTLLSRYTVTFWAEVEGVPNGN